MKKILIVITLILIGLTGCSSFTITDEQVTNYNASESFKGVHDEFEKITKYTLPISLMYRRESSLFSDNISDFSMPSANLIKVVNEDNSNYYFISTAFSQSDWLFVYKIVYMFDGEPYTLNAESHQREVRYGGGVSERYTFDISENFIKKYINAKEIRFKIYTTEQGEFENYMSGNKNDPKYGNGLKIQDKNLKFLLKTGY